MATGTMENLGSKANQTQLAPVENGSTASRAYAAGEYFCRNGLTYRVTTAISVGGTITPGTNCVEAPGGGLNDVSGEISRLWTNANTSTVFAAQTLTLNLSNYDLVIIECLPERTLVSTKISYICRVGGDAEIIQGMYLPSGTTAPMLYQRQVQVQTNGISFGDGLEKQVSATARATNNNAIHPRVIYGIKV